MTGALPMLPRALAVVIKAAHEAVQATVGRLSPDHPFFARQ